jgi:hypothetical protein
MDFQVVEFKLVPSLEYQLNIESTNSAQKIVLTEDDIKVLAGYDLVCFPEKAAKCHKLTKTKIKKFYLSLVEYLTDDFTLLSSNSNSNSNSNTMSCDGKEIFNALYDYEFELETIDFIKVEWKFFVYINAARQIAASCMVEHNKVYNTYEIHSVCVGQSGQKHCQNFIPLVFENLKTNYRDFTEIRIYCKTDNPRACGCYAHIPNVNILTNPATTAYVLYNKDKINSPQTPVVGGKNKKKVKPVKKTT